MKKIDLRDLKEGDKAWSCAHGECTVVAIVDGDLYPINISNNKCFAGFTLNGIYSRLDTHPTLFHSKEEFLEYWGFGATLEVVESNQLTKREQFAMAAMQGLLFLGHGIDKAAELSILHADALITKLNEKQ
jgi:hypothetical protein